MPVNDKWHYDRSDSSINIHVDAENDKPDDHSLLIMYVCHLPTTVHSIILLHWSGTVNLWTTLYAWSSECSGPLPTASPHANWPAGQFYNFMLKCGANMANIWEKCV